MRIAVYTIFKDEAQFAERWLASALEADHILAVDTGSTDGTAEILKNCGKSHGASLEVVNCTVAPWRFDEARNFSLHALPAGIDFCVCLDMDEVLLPGWREALEAAVRDAPETHRFRYNYIWSWKDDGSPGLTYFADKIHRRAGFRWVGPVHEVLHLDKRLGEEKQHFIQQTLIEHHPDDSKPRTQYFPLLKLATQERPDDDRAAHYYGRELYFWRHYAAAIAELERHLNLPTATWREERAASMRYIGDCHWALGDNGAAIFWFNKSLQEIQNRESYVRLAQAYRALQRWEECKDAALAALAFKERPNSYINDAVTWSDWPDRILADAEAALAAGA